MEKRINKAKKQHYRRLNCTLGKIIEIDLQYSIVAHTLQVGANIAARILINPSPYPVENSIPTWNSCIRCIMTHLRLPLSQTTLNTFILWLHKIKAMTTMPVTYLRYRRRWGR